MKEEQGNGLRKTLQRCPEKSKGDNDVNLSTTTCEYISSKLKESEDERIRKEIIEMLRNWASLHYITKKQFSERMDWLEKEGEKNPIDYNEELKKCRENPLYFFDKYVKIKEQKQTWSEKDERMLKDTLALIETVEDIYKEKDGFLDAKIWLKSLRPQNRWKPSDKQMEALRIAAEVGTANDSWAMEILKGMYNELKSM